MKTILRDCLCNDHAKCRFKFVDELGVNIECNCLCHCKHCFHEVLFEGYPLDINEDFNEKHGRQVFQDWSESLCCYCGKNKESI